jgi:hypothetical protein
MNMAASSSPVTASCRCGQVAFAIRGAPIAHVACYCASCQAAGRGFAETFGAPPVVAGDGGSDLVLYRKDRVTQTLGAGRLGEHRLAPDSPTRRMVATCCQTPMMLDFTKGHWLSFYRGCLAGEIPALEMRVMTRDKPADVTLPGDVPNAAAYPGRLMWKLLSAWAAMGFRRPRASW